MSVFTIRQEHEELTSVARFHSHSQLVGVRMKSFCATRADQEPEVKDGLGLSLQHSVSRAEASDREAAFDVRLEMKASGDEEPALPLFSVECCFQLRYSLLADYTPTQVELDAFKKGNAVFHCWPYMREFVQSATQRMGLSVPPLPILRLVPLPPKDQVPSKARTSGRKTPRPKKSTRTGRLPMN